jgi:AraC family transcriptional regulator
MALDPNTNTYPRHEAPVATHPCRPLIRCGACGTLCDWLGATIFPEHAHAGLQVVATSAEAEFTFAWRNNQGLLQHLGLKGEQIILIPSGVRHSVEWYRRAGLMSSVVDPPFALAATGGRVLTEPSQLPARAYVGTVPLIGELCAEAWYECKKPGPPNHAIIGSLGISLAAQILRAHFMPTEGEDSMRWILMRTKLAQVMSFMEEHVAEELTLDCLASRVGLSSSYFGQLFCAATGLPPMVFMTGIRVRQARELLRSGKSSATEIAHQVGFSSQQLMNDTFRRILGTAPGDYQHRAENNRAEIERRQKWARWHFC